MSEQDDELFRGSHEAGAVRDGEESDPYEYHRAYRKADYTDARYECARDCTSPPRYYTPPEKPKRETGKKRDRSGPHWIGAICLTLIAALLGGLGGSVWTQRQLSGQLGAMEERLSGYETALQDVSSGVAAVEAVHAQNAASSSFGGMSPAEIYRQATRQVVGIRSEITKTNFFGMTSSGAVSGTGFIVTEDGYILTNYHVVEDAYERGLSVDVMTYEGGQYTASIVAVEPSNDIAVLRIEAEGLNPISFGDSDSLQVGEPVYAVGNPLGELEFSMSTGYVSALDRVIKTEDSVSINMFQIDAAVNEGNSGGPLYNSLGQVVGIVTAKYSSSGVEGLGFAIPINDARTIAEDLITRGYVTGKAYMGVSLDNRYNSMYSQYYGMPLGAYVAEVTAGSAADRAGLMTGDIITSIGDFKVQEYSDLKNVLRNFSANETAEMTVYRSGSEIRLTITFDEAVPDNT